MRPLVPAYRLWSVVQPYEFPDLSYHISGVEGACGLETGVKTRLKVYSQPGGFHLWHW